jgi:hypothetical protein
MPKCKRCNTEIKDARQICPRCGLCDKCCQCHKPLKDQKHPASKDIVKKEMVKR